LELEEMCVAAVGLQQLLVCAKFRHFAVDNHRNPVSDANRREPV